jgi:hypothetical protein
MTQVEKKHIICECGNDVEVVIYNSINSADLELKKMVQDRKINNFYCDKCGKSDELGYQFLYNDMDKNRMIWCYPENRRDDVEEINEMLNQIKKMVEQENGSKGGEVKLVFGYDELIQLI